MKLKFPLFFILSLISLSQLIAQEKDWTLMVYIVGADLESGSDAATTDIAEMMTGGASTENVNILLLTGGANKPGWETPRCFLIENGVQTELAFKPSSTDMSNPNNVVEFINYGTENYPALSNMLTFWNHGGELRGFGWVDGTDDHLSINQLQNAISQSEFIKGGKKFDVLGFDACLMANLEVQSTLKDFAYYYVGSEETEPGHGWNWTPIIEAMEGRQALYGNEIGTIIVNSYKQHAIDEGTFDGGVTLSLMDLEQLPNLESKLQLLLDRIAAQKKEKSLQKAVSASEEYGKSVQVPAVSSDVVDLGDLMRQVKRIDPSLGVEVDAVLSALNSTVLIAIKDQARPKASGITTYFPHNVLSSEGELQYVIEDVYTPLNISSALKNFMLDFYIPFVRSDNSTPAGFVNAPVKSKRGQVTFSSLLLEHGDDLEHVHVVLDEEFSGHNNEYLLLGSTFPDSIAKIDENTDEYFYFWDEQWLGINGHPAYISDIHDYQIEDDMGNLKTFHRIHIPAILNNNTAKEKNIMISYRFDEDFNITLESIIHEHRGESATRVVPKERIFLKPGDEVQLIYEVFNETTDEQYFYEKPDAVIIIEKGNSDLHLEYDHLEPGSYKIGYAILDHSHNDTIIFDDNIFQVLSTNNVESFTENQIQLYPNPSDQGFNIVCPPQFETETFVMKLMDLSGKIILTTQLNQSGFIETAHIPNGIYSITLTAGSKTFADQIVIQH